MLHKNIALSERHAAHNWEYADATARAAASGFVAGDVGKLARQTGDNTLWMLTATTPTWVAVGSGGNHTHSNKALLDDMANQLAAKEDDSNKDASSGYAGLTAYKLNLKNTLGTITSWFATAATAARTWTMPDKDGTVAMTSDITGTNSGTNTGDETASSIRTKLGITTLSGDNTGDQTLASLGAQASLVSGTNIKTINGTSVLGSGDLTVSVNSATANSSTPAFTITQSGTGDALVVEDVASDSSPFVVDSTGRVHIGYTQHTPVGFNNQAGLLTSHVTSGSNASLARWSADVYGPYLNLYKSRGSAVGTRAVVVSGDNLGNIVWNGEDGATSIAGAMIYAKVDGTPGTNDMPGKLYFATTPDGSATPVDRMTISSAGEVSFPTSGTRITGDFSNATIANRPMFQTSTVNGLTNIGILPNGTSTDAALSVYNNSDVGNACRIAMSASVTEARVISAKAGTGTYLPMTFFTGGAERVRIDTSGNVGIGGASSASKLGITSDRAVNAYSQTWDTYNGATFENTLTLSHDGATTYLSNFQAKSLALGTNNTPRLTIDGTTGSVLAISPLGGLGYGAGSGGTVTQATSKATAVTLNKPSGQITMHNSALAAGASVYFTLNNTLLALADVVGVTLNSYGSNYRVETVNIANGSVVFRVTNVTVGPLSESLVINFAIIKVANS